MWLSFGLVIHCVFEKFCIKNFAWIPAIMTNFVISLTSLQTMSLGLLKQPMTSSFHCLLNSSFIISLSFPHPLLHNLYILQTAIKRNYTNKLFGRKGLSSKGELTYVIFITTLTTHKEHSQPPTTDIGNVD